MDIRILIDIILAISSISFLGTSMFQLYLFDKRIMIVNVVLIVSSIIFFIAIVLLILQIST